VDPNWGKGKVLLLWAEAISPKSYIYPCRIVEVRAIFKDLVFVLQIIKDDCEESFRGELKIIGSFQVPPGLDPLHKVSFRGP
jgi:hypothetical protein